MATLRELRKRLSSISITKQLASAMKTVSAAKYAKLETLRGRYLPYADTCSALMTAYGEAMTGFLPCINPEAPSLYIVFASNRGLCGGYNSELFRYAETVLAAEEKPYRLFVCGKMATSYFGDRAAESFLLPDVPDFADCLPLFDRIRALYTAGEVSLVMFVFAHFQNMLTQVPCSRTVLPYADTGSTETTESSEAHTSAAYPATEKPDILFFPNRETVLSGACLSLLHVTMYSIVLEACSGAQAATLIAMRSANDNAAETAARLEIEISRKRQAEVTSSVIETASGMHRES